MGIGVVKEWRCFDHGEFEASHAICPASGCDSRAVVREFRTAPTIGTRMVKQHNEGLKRSSDMYKISNFRSARAGEAAHGGMTDTQGRVLWGNESQKVLGKGFAELMQSANPTVPGKRFTATPYTIPSRTGAPITVPRNNAMADVAQEAGITHRRVAKPGEVRVPREESRSVSAAEAITR